MPSLPLPAFPRTFPTPAASSHSLQILLTPTTSSAAPSRLFLPRSRARHKVAHRAGDRGTRRSWHSPACHRPGDAREDCLHPGVMQPRVCWIYSLSPSSCQGFWIQAVQSLPCLKNEPV